jgi:hypothetical protein
LLVQQTSTIGVTPDAAVPLTEHIEEDRGLIPSDVARPVGRKEGI